MLTSNLFIGMLSSDVLFGGSFPFSISPAPQKHPSHWHIGWIEPILKKVWVCRNLHKNLLRGVRHIRVHLYEVWFCVGSPSRRHICQSRATSSSAASVFLPGLHSGNLVRSELGSSFPSVRWCLAFPWAAVGFGFSCRQLEEEPCSHQNTPRTLFGREASLNRRCSRRWRRWRCSQFKILFICRHI